MNDDAAKVLKSQGIRPCTECKWSMLPYKNDDFHSNAQCHAPKNKTIKVSPVTHTEYPEYKWQFCKNTRSDESACGAKGVWFEPIMVAKEASTTMEATRAEGGRRIPSSSR